MTPTAYGLQPSAFQNPMLTVDEALDRILHEVTPPSPVDVSLHDALGLVLAENVVSDTDSPPFDKSMMDGYAVRQGDG